MKNKLIKIAVAISIFCLFSIFSVLPNSVLAATPDDLDFDDQGLTATFSSSLDVGSLRFTTDNSGEVAIVNHGAASETGEAVEDPTFFTENVIVNDFSGSNSPTMFQFESINTGNNFKMKSMYMLTTMLTSMNASSVFDIKGYNDGTLVASVSGVNLSSSGSYGDTSDSIDYSISIDNPTEKGGLLTFNGSSWDEIDKVVITDTGSDQPVQIAIDSMDFSNVVDIFVSDATVNEANDTASFTVSLSKAYSSPITVDYATADNTAKIAAGDYTSTSGTATIPTGSQTVNITVPINNDTDYEEPESFYMNLTNSSAGEITDTQGVCTIDDNDTAPTVTLSIADSSFSENSGSVIITATLSNKSYQAVNVDLAYSGTAAKGTDYTKLDSIVIPARSLTNTITITAIDDDTYEDNETIIAEISGVTNGTENGTQSVTASITDNDLQPTVSLELTNSPLGEAGGTATVTARLSHTSYQDITVSLGLTGTAINGKDYTLTANSIVIPAGSLSNTATIIGKNDTAYETTETVIVDITSVICGTESTEQQVTASIADDDTVPAVTLSTNRTSISENGESATITATLSNVSYQDVTVELSFAGTAIGSGTDYTVSTAQIVIPAGSTSNTVIITGIDDTAYEETESVIVQITSVLGGTESTEQQAKVSITDGEVFYAITAFDAIKSVNAGNVGSAVSGSAIIATLPTTVTANGGAVTVPVTGWTDTDGYDSNVAGSYTFTAILGTLPIGYSNAGGYTATVDVIVTSPGQLIFDTIANVNAGNAGSAVYTDAVAVITTLPTVVTASGGAITVSVTAWTDTDGYNPNVAGSYTFTATLGTFPTGYTTAGNTVTIEVIVSTVTPNAPTNPIQDDSNNTFGWTYVSGYPSILDYEYSLDGGITWTTATVTPLSVANKAYAAGAIQVRIKADAVIGRLAGDILSSTIAYTANSTSGQSSASGSESNSVNTNTNTNTTVRQAVVKASTDTSSFTVAKVDITRTTENNKTVDSVVLDKTKMEGVLKNAAAEGNDTVSIIIDSLPGESADEVSVSVENSSMDKLEEVESSLQIQAEGVSIELPKETVQALSKSVEDLYLRVEPVRSETEQQAVIENALQAAIVIEVAGTSKAKVLGTPMTIETNYKDLSTKVTFSLKDIDIPTDSVLREEFIKNLAVFIQHSDGEQVIDRGTIVYDSNGNPVGIEIEITKFSTFTILSVKNVPPTATDARISGKVKVGSKLTASYTYSDFDKDEQGKATYKWYRADNAKGKNKKAVSRANKSTYTITKKDEGKYIIVEITPIAKSGAKKGTKVTASTKTVIKKQTVTKKQDATKK